MKHVVDKKDLEKVLKDEPKKKSKRRSSSASSDDDKPRLKGYGLVVSI